jgi:hypothetical protein
MCQKKNKSEQTNLSKKNDIMTYNRCISIGYFPKPAAPEQADEPFTYLPSKKRSRNKASRDLSSIMKKKATSYFMNIFLDRVSIFMK